MLDTGWLDVYLLRAEALPESDPIQRIAVKAVGKMMNELGREGIIEEMKKLPPEGEGDETQERRRRGLEAGLVGLTLVDPLVIKKL